VIGDGGFSKSPDGIAASNQLSNLDNILKSFLTFLTELMKAPPSNAPYIPASLIDSFKLSAFGPSFNHNLFEPIGQLVR
jgi:hypothetical protein